MGARSILKRMGDMAENIFYKGAVFNKAIVYVLVFVCFAESITIGWLTNISGDLLLENDTLKSNVCLECYYNGRSDAETGGYTSGFQDCMRSDPGCPLEDVDGGE